MSMVYFKGGAVHFDLCFLVGKAFTDVTIWISRRKTIGYSSELGASFHVSMSIYTTQFRSFSRLGVKLWNKIPSYISNLPKKAFKRVLRKSPFDILEMEDDYIDIPLIINKLGY